jgi:hypothetical protein
MRDVKYSLDWLLKTKSDLMKMLDSSRQTLKQAKEDTEIWEMMVNDVDAEIAEIQKKQRVLRQASGRVRIGVIIVSVLVIVTIIISGAK